MNRSRRLALLAGCLTLFHVLPVCAQTTRVVSSVADDGPGSLREAITSAVSGDTITFDLAFPVPIFIRDELTIAVDLTIVGPGVTNLAIAAKPGVFAGDPQHFRVFTVNAGTTVNMSGFTITKGQADLYGGGIYNGGTLQLTDMSVIENFAYYGAGGGIYNAGDLTLTNTVVSANANYSGSGGGGICNNGSMRVVNSTISANWTGGGSTKGNGILNVLSATVTNSTIANNYGTGFGGGLANVGVFNLINSTVVGNGGRWYTAILNERDVYLVHSAVVANPFDPMFHLAAIGNGAPPSTPPAVFVVKNTIVAGNGPNCLTFFRATSAGYNLSDDDTCFNGPLDLIHVGPGLDPNGAQMNGGPTATVALAVTSLAVDAVPAAFCTDLNDQPIPTDQRGTARPQGPACDIGAFELVETGAYTVTTVPAGLRVTVDGGTYAGPQAFHWLAGTSHTIAADTQVDADGVQWVLSDWSDGGASTHNIAAPETPNTFTANFTVSVTSVTIATTPAGLPISVDGQSYTAPQTFQWVNGSHHTIETDATHAGPAGTRYVFSGWSDSGAIAHSITVPVSPVTFTAGFTTQYLLTTTADPAAGGTVTAGGYFDAGTSVAIAASASAGYTFASFSGDLSGPTTPQNLVMSAPRSVTANFTALTSAVTIATVPSGRAITVDGVAYTAPQTFNWATASSHTVATTGSQPFAPGGQFAFASWSDGGAISHIVTGPPAAATFTAVFNTQYLLSTAANPSSMGSITPSTYVTAGETVMVTATPNPGYILTGFSGSLSGTANPQSFVMNAPASVTADFAIGPASVTVTNRNDGGVGSLRHALATVRIGGIVEFDPLLTGSIQLNSALAIDRSLTINGPASHPLVILGGVDRVFIIPAGTTVTLSRLDIQKGVAVSGAAIYNLGTLTVMHSAVSNTVSRGSRSAIFNSGSLTLMNTTVARAAVGIENRGTLALIHATVALNTTGIEIPEGSVTVKNTLLAENGGNCSVGAASIADAGYNLSDDFTCASLTAPTDVPAGTGADLVTILQNSGGSTSTLALLSTSPAVNAIPAEFCTDVDGNPVHTDQRGVARPQGAACDIGAFELAPAPTANPQSVSTPPNTPVTITLTGSGFVNCEMTFSLVPASPPSHGALGPLVDQTCGAGNPNADSATVTYTPDAGYTGTDSFTFRVNDGSDSTPATIAITVIDPGQAITVTMHAPSAAAYGDAFGVAATADSLLPVAITAAGSCMVSGGGSGSATIQMTAGSGVCTVHYNQAGDSSHTPAPELTESTTAGVANQATLVVTGPGSVMYGTTGTAAYTGGSGTGAVSFSAGSSTGCAVNGTTVSVTSAGGTCALTATKAADANYKAASSLAVPVLLVKASQTIAFGPLENVITLKPPVAVSAVASSGLRVTFTTTTPSVCTAGGANGATITLKTNGICEVAAHQSGNANYAAAADVIRSFNVGKVKADQTIAFAVLADKTLAQSPVAVSATASSGLAVAFTTTTPSVCSAEGKSGASIKLRAPGTCTVVADQKGNAEYNAAPSVRRSFAVTAAPGRK